MFWSYCVCAISYLHKYFFSAWFAFQSLWLSAKKNLLMLKQHQLASWGHLRVHRWSSLCRPRGELEHCQPGIALRGTLDVCWPWQCVTHLHNQTDKAGLAGGQQQHKSEDLTYTHNMAEIREHSHMHSGQVTMETTPPREPSSSHPLSVLQCPSQTGTTAVCMCVCVCFNCYHFAVSLQKVQLRGTSKGIMSLSCQWKHICVCVCVCGFSADFVLFIINPVLQWIHIMAYFIKSIVIKHVLPNTKLTNVYRTFLNKFLLFSRHLWVPDVCVCLYLQLSTQLLRNRKLLLVCGGWSWARMRTKAEIIPSSTSLVHLFSFV